MNHRPATCFYVTPLNCPRVFSFGMPCIVRNSRFHNRCENQRNSVRFVVRFLARFLPILGTFTHLRPRYFHALFFLSPLPITRTFLPISHPRDTPPFLY